jgi:hypothetical protein
MHPLNLRSLLSCLTSNPWILSLPTCPTTLTPGGLAATYDEDGDGDGVPEFLQAEEGRKSSEERGGRANGGQASGKPEP